MNEESRPVKRLSLLDYAFDLLDGPRSRQDFALIFHLREPPALEDLRAGANSAMNRYPVSGSMIRNRRWVYAAGKTISEIAISGSPEIETFLDEHFDLRFQRPVKQLLHANGAREACLVTRFHHAAADGISAALWLGHQLSVAYKLKTPDSFPPELSLRQSVNRVRRSRFAYNVACDPLWTTNYIPSGAKRWLTINFPATELQQACRRARGFTYSDLLATCALEVFRHWNRKHVRAKSHRIGLWLPMNIRGSSSDAFGNGTSRIRLYARYSPDASLADKAREVRRQVSWSTRHGEWVVPELPLFTRLPRWVVEPVLNGYLKQPSVDMATGIFSHADRWVGDAGEAFRYVQRIECVGLLHPRQHLAINGATHQRQTWLTFTYDPALLDVDAVRQLTRMYEEQLDLARKELA